MEETRVTGEREAISKPTGSVDVSHNANNMNGQSTAHVNRGGATIPGRTSDRDGNPVAEKRAERYVRRNDSDPETR